MDTKVFRHLELGHHASALAHLFYAEPGKPSNELRLRFKQNRQILFQAYYVLSDSANQDKSYSPSTEWYLDNFFLIREQLTLISKHYSRKFNESLPVCTEGQIKKAPRIYNIIIDFIEHTNGHFDLIDLNHFIESFQNHERLTIGELWATPIMLRLSIIEKIRRLSMNMVAQRLDRDNARRWFSRFLSIINQPSSQTLLLIRELAQSDPTFTPAFVSEFARCCQSQESLMKISLVTQWIEMKLKESGSSIEHCLQLQNQKLAKEQIEMSNLISSIRLISQINWQDFTESNSVVHEQLKKDPSQIYAQMDFQTRDRYRNAIETIAKNNRIPEWTVAEKLLQWSEKKSREFQSLNQGEKLAEQHLGYYLIDAGKEDFLASMNFKLSFKEILVKLLREHSFLLFFLGINLGSLALTFWITPAFVPQIQGHWLSYGFVFIGLFLLTSQLLLAITFSFFHRLISPQYLPRMDYSSGIPASAKTIVVVPTLLLTEQSTQELVKDLEIRYLGNQDPHLYFALLTDFCDAISETLENDNQLLTLARTGIQKLNEKHQGSRFFLFHRPRRWNEAEKKWMGYERKRGKLEDLGLLLENPQDQKSFSVIEGDLHCLVGIKYIITLDTDTQLSPGSAAKLIGNIDHPLNQPIYGDASKTVRRGYGLLQPRIGSGIPLGASSPYFKIFNPEIGVNPYTKLVSDVYQDFFEEGSFIGKGIYDRRAFHCLMQKRFPENRILSHDLIEGCFVRSGLVADVVLYEDQPQDFLTDILRRHRWTRGDWQIASWLLPMVPGFQNQKEKNQLSGLSRWKIFDNLRRSCVSIGAVSLFIWSILSPQQVGLKLSLIVLLIALPFVFGAVDQLYISLKKSFTTSFVGFSFHRFYRPLVQGFFYFIFLPIEAFQNLDAIIRTLYRLSISKQFLLEWTCFHSLKSGKHRTVQYYYRLFWPTPLMASFLLVFLLWKAPDLQWPAYAFSLLTVLWLLAPGIVWWISQPTDDSHYKLKNSDLAYLEKLAQDIWSYFESFENEENHWLPPDNVQLNQSLKIANRTSPTNIGLSLTSTLAAWDLGFISTQKLLDRIEKQFASLNQLERYRGHFLNWYDTLTLKPLLPKYVSTVDNGNFIGSLYVLKQGLQEVSKTLTENNDLDKLKRILEQIEEFLEADFSFLFDANVKLFAIGYNVSDQRRDKGYYDLLASEARLTSYLSIVKGQVPFDHWFALGRSITSIKGKASLLSWSGSMFEYLMPNLYMPLYKGSLIETSCLAAVNSQIEYGKHLGIPWGMSESGYFATDQAANYQYRAFGVPELGYKRDLQYELVIAPYASALALMVDPQRAIQNLRDLDSRGFRGAHGFFEAIDYTNHRLAKGERYGLVQSFMAHHQGMSLIALTNLLKDNLMIHRFMADPRFQAFNILLQESVPDTRPVKALEFEAEPVSASAPETKKEVVRALKGGQNYPQEAALLSNGHYSVMMTNNGAGYSRNQKIALTPWRDDQLQGLDGLFFYISDLQNSAIWSSTYFPTLTQTKTSDVQFYDSQIDVERQHLGINCKTSVSVSPIDNIEVRTLRLSNASDTTRSLKVTSFAEIALTPNLAFLSHPAFSKLFVESAISKKLNAIICERRRRSPKDPTSKLFHSVVIEDDASLVTEISFETDRMKFIGRDGSLSEPKAIRESWTHPLSNSSGATLDPIVSIQCALRLPPKKSIQLHFLLGYSDSDHSVENTIIKYSDLHMIKKIRHMAWTHSKSFSDQLGVSDEEVLLFNKLGNYIIFPSPHLRGFMPDSEAIRSKNTASLWRYGISGDRPILLVSVSSTKSHDLVRQLLKAHSFLRHKGLCLDLILISTEEVSYRHEISDYLNSLTSSFIKAELIDRPEGVFVRRAGDFPSADRIFLKHLAAVTILDTEGTLEEQIDRAKHLSQKRLHRPVFASRTKSPPSPMVPSSRPLLFDNTIGGYTSDGNEYLIEITKAQITPLPWANVIANPDFGTVISERGSSYTWFQNAHEYRLSPWTNDFVEDRTGELLYLRDENSGQVWSPIRPVRGQSSQFIIKHGFGYSQFQTNQNGIQSTVTIFVSLSSPVKIILIDLLNTGTQPRELSATYFVDLTLGEHRPHSQHHILTSTEKKSGILFAQNPKNVDFSNYVTFLKVSSEKYSFTCERSEFIGYEGNLELPEGLKNKTLSQTKSCTVDPIFALQGFTDVPSQRRKELSFFLGASPSMSEAQALTERFGNLASAHRKLNAVKQRWHNDLKIIEIKSKDSALDLLTNGWLLYQTMSARFFGRTGFYQSGGAYGFRDQLQDAMAFVYNRPDLLREQIIRCASMQFIEGDVLHWWHPPFRRGVRTRITDDLLWLPLAVSRYVKVTGDTGVLNERTPFLKGPEVPATEEAHYSIPAIADQDGTIYEHCVRAIRRSLQFGRHGLPLMGGGDWNDGMNDVGHLGRGESVWLGFFLHEVLFQFRDLAELKGDQSIVNTIDSQMNQLSQNIEANAWDGEWYRRAYFDDGTPLGSSRSPECQIDLLPQCWSVLSGVGSRERMKQAMKSVERRLVDEKNGLIRLLDPPFDGQMEPGYIKGYIPGIRENGAQYTHAAVWTIMAFIKLGYSELAWKYFTLINPINHGLTKEAVEQYKVEPYVVAADVYSQTPHQGRGGWTWYTGSASWMYRLIIEFFIGMEMKDGKLICFKPFLPQHLDEIKVHYRFEKSLWEFHLQRIRENPAAEPPEGASEEIVFKTEIEIDGRPHQDPWIEMFSDGESHKVSYRYAKTIQTQPTTERQTVGTSPNFI